MRYAIPDLDDKEHDSPNSVIQARQLDETPDKWMILSDDPPSSIKKHNDD